MNFERKKKIRKFEFGEKSERWTGLWVEKNFFGFLFQLEADEVKPNRQFFWRYVFSLQLDPGVNSVRTFSLIFLWQNNGFWLKRVGKFHMMKQREE